jgi:anti-anti-sigma factor
MFRRHAVHSEQGELLCGSPQLCIRSRRDGHVHVVQLVGELDMTTAQLFEDELKRVEASDAWEIVVDLSGLRFISADGLKAFIHASARARHANNRLRLVRGPDEVQRTFETTGLVSRLPFSDDVDVRRSPVRAPVEGQDVVSKDGSGPAAIVPVGTAPPSVVGMRCHVPRRRPS